ncbi:MAG: protein kinase, partial [Firmicutes bacterium]|nr:protein kinase [Bacillota bacterium]
LSWESGAGAKTAEVEVKIPDDGLVHRVKIVVADSAGTRVALGPEDHNSGDRFTRLITYYNKGKIQVYVDDKLIREELVS